MLSSVRAGYQLLGKQTVFDENAIGEQSLLHSQETTDGHIKRRISLTLTGSVLLLLVGAVGGIWLYNQISAQRPLDRVIAVDPRNHVVKASAHFEGWIDFNSLVFDIADVSPNATRLDVFRTLNQYAQTMKEQRFKRIILAARGKNKFVLEGDYFQMLGQEYDTQNPMYTMRTFPTHLTAMDGSRPYVEYTGGIFAVLEKELEQFTAFHDAWYVQDFATEIK